jgi:hypothetical protein
MLILLHAQENPLRINDLHYNVKIPASWIEHGSIDASKEFKPKGRHKLAKRLCDHKDKRIQMFQKFYPDSNAIKAEQPCLYVGGTRYRIRVNRNHKMHKIEEGLGKILVKQGFDFKGPVPVKIQDPLHLTFEAESNGGSGIQGFMKIGRITSALVMIKSDRENVRESRRLLQGISSTLRFDPVYDYAHRQSLSAVVSLILKEQKMRLLTFFILIVCIVIGIRNRKFGPLWIPVGFCVIPSVIFIISLISNIYFR